MTISLGIDHSKNLWRICLIEDGQVLECVLFDDDSAIFSYLEHTCTLYPEPIIALSSDLHVPLSPLNMLVEDMLRSPEYITGHDDAFSTFLIALNTINFRNYILPGIEYLESIPLHRKLYRGPLGDTARLCRIATLLYRLRLQDTVWTNMCFLYLEVGRCFSRIAVVKGGQIVDAIRTKALHEEALYTTCDNDAFNQDMVSAFLEMLTQDLAGLLALHHYEDVVLAYDYLAPPRAYLKNALIDRFGDLYQIYLSPVDESRSGSFDAAIGAAILAEGLSHPGLAAEVVERLL